MTLTGKEINIRRKIDRKLALEKLPQVCVVCGTDQKLEVHHKNLNRPAGDLKNLIMLCRKCHHRYHELSQLRKIAKSRLELYYGREVTAVKRVYFEKVDITKNEDLPINMVRVMEPHVQSYLLLRTLLWNWSLYIPNSLEKLNLCFEIVDDLKRVLITQKDWKQAVQSMNKAKEQMESLLRR